MENLEKDLDPEFTGYMKVCVDNLVDEVNHLKEFLAKAEDSYIRSNPEEVASEIAMSGMTVMHILGAYNVLDGIREYGMVPKISFMEDGEEPASKT